MKKKGKRVVIGRKVIFEGNEKEEEIEMMRYEKELRELGLKDINYVYEKVEEEYLYEKKLKED